MYVYICLGIYVCVCVCVGQPKLTAGEKLIHSDRGLFSFSGALSVLNY